MNRESLHNARHYSRSEPLTSKRKSGVSNVVSAVIMIAAISIMGSAMLIWANGVFGGQQRTIGNYYEQNSNLLKETFTIEDVWLSKPPVADYVNVTIRNVGDIAINATQVQVTAVNDTGMQACSPATQTNQFRTSWQCDPGTSYTQTAKPPYAMNSANGWIQSKGLISSKSTLRIDVGTIDWDNPNSKSLNIQVTTARGSIQLIVWKVT